MFEYLIVGGGLSGVLSALYIIKKAGYPAETVGIVDPAPTLLARWHATTRACGMRYLRSSSSHAIDTDFRSLRRFAARSTQFGERDFTPPYRRPSLQLFNAHTTHVMNEAGIPALHLQGTVTQLSRSARGNFVLRTTQGELHTRRVVLALGPGDLPSYPSWAAAPAAGPGAQGGSKPGVAAQHIYDPLFQCGIAAHAGPKPHVVIVGGGIGAAQHACMLVRRFEAQVTVVARHQPVMRVFDFNPCYVGPSCLPTFQALATCGERRKLLTQERYPGTLPPDVYAEITSLIASEQITWVVGELTKLRPLGSPGGKQHLEITLRSCSPPGGPASSESAPPDGPASGESAPQGGPASSESAPPDGPASGSEYLLTCHELRLATGLESKPGRHPLLRHLSSAHAAPVDTDGTPVLSAELEWIPGLSVVGRAAELEIGPPAGNIIGMHNAAKRLCL